MTSEALLKRKKQINKPQVKNTFPNANPKQFPFTY